MSLKDYGLEGERLRGAIHIDTEQEYMLGDDQAYFNYPVRFPTVEFELAATTELCEIVDAIRKEKGLLPMLEDDGDSEGYAPDHHSTFENVWNTLKAFINKMILSQVYVSIEDMTKAIVEGCNFSKYKARAICEVIIASMDAYRRNYSRGSSTIVKEMATNAGQTKYLFNVAVNSYLSWVERIYRTIVRETREGKLYLVNDGGTLLKETSTVLGILEAVDILSFNMIGGANSQLYIYIHQTRSLEDILNRPSHYKNRLLDAVSIRHLISVKMLTYIYEGGFSSEETWDLLEDYFLGTIPEKVKRDCRKENPNIAFDG